MSLDAKRSPSELVQALAESLEYFENHEESDPENVKVQEQSSKILSQMKTIFNAGTGSDGSLEAILEDLWKIMGETLKELKRFDSEGQMDVVEIFSLMRRHQVVDRSYLVDKVLAKHNDIMRTLVTGHENLEVCMNYGKILRDFAESPPLADYVFSEGFIFFFFDRLETSNMDAALEAMATFKVLMTKQNGIGKYLEENYEVMFQRYNKLLNPQNAAICREALQLLNKLLLGRSNHTSRMRYIGDPEHLSLILGLLKDQNREVQFEAFNVFKLFVGNPSRTPPIQQILLQEKDHLIEYLTNFQTDRSEDEQFNDEKAYIIEMLKTYNH